VSPPKRGRPGGGIPPRRPNTLTSSAARKRDTQMLTTNRRQPKRATRRTKKNEAEGFTMHPNWLFDSRFGPMTRYVYLVLLKHDWLKTGVVWPAVDTIADEAGVSPRTAYNSLYELREAGLITIRKRPGDTHRNEYVIHTLSQQQIEALCRHEPEAAEPAGGAGSKLQEVQVEPAGGAHEEEQEKETQGKRPTGLAGHTSGVSPADAGAPAEEEPQGVPRRAGQEAGIAGSTAGPGSTAGTVGSTPGPGSTDGTAGAAGSTDGPGCTAGPHFGLAATPVGSAGPTAGAGPSQGNDFGVANTKNLWTSNLSTESKGSLYSRPLPDTEKEMRVSLIADYVMSTQLLKKPVSREATMKTARFWLDHDGKQFGEVIAVLRHAAASGDRWKSPSPFVLRKDYYNTILLDLCLSYLTPEQSAAHRERNGERMKREDRDRERMAQWVEDETNPPPPPTPVTVDLLDNAPGTDNPDRLTNVIKPPDSHQPDDHPLPPAPPPSTDFASLRARLERHDEPPPPPPYLQTREERLAREAKAAAEASRSTTSTDHE
jgi:hypothetical protein